MLTRRGAIGGLAAPFILGATGAGARIGGPAAEQAAGFARFSLGAFGVTVLSDGHLPRPTDLYAVDPGQDGLRSFLRERRQPEESTYSHCNHVMVETGDATVLFDIGSGDKLTPTVGRLIENMEAAEIDPADVTHLALTHAHPDHVWGMMDDFGDEKRAPEAEVSIGAAEFDWWMKDGRIDDVPAEDQGMVVGAQNALGAVADEIRLMQPGDAVVSGVTAMDSPGHTAGHRSFMVESDGHQLIVIGDALVNPYISFEQPDWRFGRDQDQDQAAATRRRLLDMAATDGIAVIGYHLPFPGVGYVARAGEGFRFIPEPLTWGG